MKISLRWPSLAFLLSFFFSACDDEKVTPPDTAAPEITINEFGEFVKGTIPVTISATDNIEIASIALSINGTEVATSQAGELNYSWDTKTLEDGIAKLQVSVADKSGNEAVKDIDVNIMNYFFRFNVGSGYAASDDSYHLYISDYDGNILGTIDLETEGEIKVPTPDNYVFGSPVALNSYATTGKSVAVISILDCFPGNYNVNRSSTGSAVTIVGEHDIKLTGVEEYERPMLRISGRNIPNSTQDNPVDGGYQAKLTSETSDLFFSLVDAGYQATLKPRFAYLESASVGEVSEFALETLTEPNQKNYSLGFTANSVLAITYATLENNQRLKLFHHSQLDAADAFNMYYPGDLFDQYRFFYNMHVGDLEYTSQYDAAVPNPTLDFLTIEMTESSYVNGELNLQYTGTCDNVVASGFKIFQNSGQNAYYITNVYAPGNLPVSFKIATPPENLLFSDQLPAVNELVFDLLIFEDYEDVSEYRTLIPGFLDASLWHDGGYTAKAFWNDINTKKSSFSPDNSFKINERKLLTSF